MIPPRVIPVLQIEDGALVKTKVFGKPRYLGDPINAVKIFNDKHVDELIVVDIGAARRRSSPDLSLLSQIASEAFMPVGYGGNVNSVDTARRIVDLGLEKIFVSSALVESPNEVTRMALALGSQSVVASIDYRGTTTGPRPVFTRGGHIATGRNALELACEAAHRGAGEILLSSIEREGTRVGYDIDLLREVCESVTVPVVCLGGAGGENDFAKALTAGASAVASGSRFVFYGRLDAVLIRYLPPDVLDELTHIAAPTSCSGMPSGLHES